MASKHRASRRYTGSMGIRRTKSPSIGEDSIVTELVDLLGADVDTSTRERIATRVRDIMARKTGMASRQAPATSSSDPETDLVMKAADVIGFVRLAAWMNTPIPALGDRTPYSLMGSEEGRRQVEQVLGRIEHGVY
jgi:uncharacterized protein (DUF2384 family)